MPAPLAELLIKLGVDDRELDQLDQGISGRLQAVGGKVSAAGASLTRSVSLPLAAAGAGLFALAGKQEEAETLMVSSFDSMAAAGWTTVDELKAQASAFQEATTFGDEGILEMQSVLLTFGNVTGDVFGDASGLILDMSAKLGTNLQSSAIQVGKALNDPVKGISALSEVGVSFTEDQKEMVKTMANAGDTAGAQAVILGELEKQFGGTAEAMAKTGTGQAKQAMNALGDAGESIGQFLIPVVSKLAGWLKTLATAFQSLSPETQKWIVRIGAVAAAIGPVLFVGGKLISMFGMVGKAFTALSTLMAANPWVLLIAATVALVVLIVKNWDKITAFLQKAWEWIKNTAGAVWDFLKGIFKAGLDFVKNLFLNWTGPGLLIKHWDTIKDGALAVKDWIVEKFNQVVDFFKGIPGRISSAVSGMWDGLKTAFRSAVNWIIDKWNNFRITIGGFKLPGWLGGGTAPSFTINTPNIPRLHQGTSFFQPPGGAREGLAVLERGESVTPKGGMAGNHNYFVLSWQDFVRKAREAGVEMDRLGWT